MTFLLLHDRDGAKLETCRRAYGVIMHRPFRLIASDPSRTPHRFEAYRYDRAHQDCWRALVRDCLAAWRLNAEAFYAQVEQTGFSRMRSGLQTVLNERGRSQLPGTPAEDGRVTRDPAITDLTEVLAIRVLEQAVPDLVLPYPRVLHKESYPLQHHGIDLLGYRKENGEHLLYVIEVMASAQDAHPPQTVRDHRRQLLEETLNAPDAKRLLRDLQFVHDEADGTHRSVLNGFIIALLDTSGNNGHAVVAGAVLVVRTNCFDQKDWGPFSEHTKLFEQARIPSSVLFICIECHESFSGLLDLVKATAAAQPENASTSEGKI